MVPLLFFDTVHVSALHTNHKHNKTFVSSENIAPVKRTNDWKGGNTLLHAHYMTVLLGIF